MSDEQPTKPTVDYKDIPFFPNHRVGDDGSVWTCLSDPEKLPQVVTDQWRQLPQKINGNGYAVVMLKVIHPMLVHHLVLDNFEGMPHRRARVFHINGDKGDNRLDNLRYGREKKEVKPKKYKRDYYI